MSERLSYRAVEIPAVSGIGKTEVHRLIKTGELESFKIGRARYVTRQALLDFMAKRIAEQKQKPDNGRP